MSWLLQIHPKFFHPSELTISSQHLASYEHHFSLSCLEPTILMSVTLFPLHAHTQFYMDLSINFLYVDNQKIGDNYTIEKIGLSSLTELPVLPVNSHFSVHFFRFYPIT